jgi:hypothetical protein
MDFRNKRYCPWQDDTLWGERAAKSGLLYGVYDNELNRKCTDKEQGGLIQSKEQSVLKAVAMNIAIKKSK